MKNCKAKFVFNTMVSNEAHCVTRMLESVCDYVDYWVIQDNGSKDGTQEIVRNFFKEKGIPGFLYEIPWSGCMGTNRDHTVQTCLKANHGCDWILRVDADEILVVEEGFDWSVFDDLSVQSFDICAHIGVSKFFRTWLWNAKLPWKFKHDKRHECIYLDKDGVGEGFQRVRLDERFSHRLVSTGRTSMNPYKYYMDALELERDMLAKDEMAKDFYHLYYLAKSYHDNIPTDKLPFKDEHNHELARRGLFFFKQYLDLTHDFSATGKAKHGDEGGYTACLWMCDMYGVLGDVDSQINILKAAGTFCPQRNEHLRGLATLFHRRGDYQSMHEITSMMMQRDRKNPFPHFAMFIDRESYWDTGTLAAELHKAAEEGVLSQNR